jgi:uncharacterized protein Veg
MYYTLQKHGGRKRKIARNGESFVFRQTHFIVNKDIEQRGNILTYDPVQCDGFQTVNSCLKMAK